MPLTYECAKAFVAACLGSPKVKSHLEAAIGFDRLPTMDQFDGTDADGRDRCEELIGYFEEVRKVIAVVLKTRPRQGKLDFEAGDGKPAPKGSKKEALKN